MKHSDNLKWFGPKVRPKQKKGKEIIMNHEEAKQIRANCKTYSYKEMSKEEREAGGFSKIGFWDSPFLISIEKILGLLKAIIISILMVLLIAFAIAVFPIVTFYNSFFGIIKKGKDKK